MKVGEGGEAFFVFETEDDIPNELLTSPVISPSSSPLSSPPSSPQKSPGYSGSLNSPSSSIGDSAISLQEPDYLDLTQDAADTATSSTPDLSDKRGRMELLPLESSSSSPKIKERSWVTQDRAVSPGTKQAALDRARELSRKFTDINIPSQVEDNGDLVLDMTGYKSGDIVETDVLVKKLLAEEFGNDAHNIGQLVGQNVNGKLRIYSTDDSLYSQELAGTGAGGPSGQKLKNSYTTPDLSTDNNLNNNNNNNNQQVINNDSDVTHYAKSLRLSSQQLRDLKLNYGSNNVSFAVNKGKATISSKIFYWKYDEPIVISDIDGTITKSDALGHVLTMLGRDWTHAGVAKLFSDIEMNGYKIMYLTARSIGQADSTRSYLLGVEQESIKLPIGPVILSPDRTIAALRREVILRKPEVFKMACLRDIQGLFGNSDLKPFYAGFGNRITDALSYRSVGIPSSRIFTINPNAEVHMELLELAGYKSSYVHIGELVDHFFPPVIARAGGDERFNDVNFWRERLPELSDLDESENESEASVDNDDEEEQDNDEEEEESESDSSTGSESDDDEDDEGDEEEDEEEEDEDDDNNDELSVDNTNTVPDLDNTDKKNTDEIINDDSPVPEFQNENNPNEVDLMDDISEHLQKVTIHNSNSKEIDEHLDADSHKLEGLGIKEAGNLNKIDMEDLYAGLHRLEDLDIKEVDDEDLDADLNKLEDLDIKEVDDEDLDADLNKLENLDIKELDNSNEIDVEDLDGDLINEIDGEDLDGDLLEDYERDYIPSSSNINTNTFQNNNIDEEPPKKYPGFTLASKKNDDKAWPLKDSTDS